MDNFIRELIKRLEESKAPSFISKAPNFYKEKMKAVFGTDNYENVSKVDSFSVGDVECIGDSSVLYCSGDISDLKEIESRAEDRGLDTVLIPNQDLLIITMG